MGLFVDLLLLGVILTRRSCVGCKDSSHEVNGRVGRDHQHDFASMEINHSHENDEMAHRHLHEATDDNDGMTHRHLHERADGNGKNGECGFIPPTPEEAKRDEKRMRLWRLGRGSSASKFDYRIPTYVHVLLPSATEDIVPEANVATYMSYLNAAFASSTPFVFNLMDVTRTVNQNWSNNCNNGTIETAFKTMLRRGGKESLNIYICNKSYAGYSYSPSQNSGVKDGVVLERTNPTDLRRPNTLVHEVGHWLGLLHTFVGNCDVGATNDLVDDTPQHVSSAASINCKSDPSTWDSCPSLPGLDPVDNYMTYSNNNHVCRTRFTKGQVERMKAQFEIYRFNGGPAPPSAPIPSAPVPSTPVATTPQSPPVQPPTDKCNTIFSRCSENSDCCLGNCRKFLFLPKFCRLF